MPAYFDENTALAEDEQGIPICYDWLRDHQEDVRAPVRVQVKQAFVEKEWKLAWTDTAAVVQRFNAVKKRHVEAALREKCLPRADYCVYTIK
jgi:hypothetical protein